MRAIKFRAWDKRYGLVKIRHLCFSEKSGNIHTIHGSFDNGQSSLSTDDKKETILMQYTGLKDCKGREIYEGDIVKLTGDLEEAYKDEYNTISEVIFDDDNICFDAPKIACALNKHTCFEFEVIGNIYQNPELIGDLK